MTKYHVAFPWKEVLAFAVTWRELEDMELSEMSRQDVYCLMSLRGGLRNRQFRREKEDGGCQGKGE